MKIIARIIDALMNVLSTLSGLIYFACTACIRGTFTLNIDGGSMCTVDGWIPRVEIDGSRTLRVANAIELNKINGTTVTVPRRDVRTVKMKNSGRGDGKIGE